jgi:hypothetical protein
MVDSLTKLAIDGDININKSNESAPLRRTFYSVLCTNLLKTPCTNLLKGVVTRFGTSSRNLLQRTLYEPPRRGGDLYQTLRKLNPT